MPTLEIFSRDKSIYWRVPLAGKPLRLGRMPGLVDIVTPPQDNFISRIHATVHWRDGQLHVARHADANNPVYRIEPGKPPAPTEEMNLLPGESFQIGSTVFRVCPDGGADTTSADAAQATITNETSFDPEKVREFRFADADQRVAALADLPQLILSTQHERMLEQQVLDTMLKGIPEADVVAIVRLEPDCREEDPRVQVLALKCREQAKMSGADEHRPSRRLVHNAIRYYSPTHHVWQAGHVNPAYTTDATMD
jgi:adenylate cyclase